MICIYIHGFNSGYNPFGYKVEALKKIARVTGVTYDSFMKHDAVFPDMEQQLHDILEPCRTDNPRSGRDIFLAGTSLGGFWAAKFSNHFGIPAVLINPTIHPQKSLKRYTGLKMLNFVTRTRNTLHREVPDSYRAIEGSGDFLILLDKGDEVLDYRQAEQWFAGDNINNSINDNIIIFEAGSHRFDHMEESLPDIRKFMNLPPPDLAY